MHSIALSFYVSKSKQNLIRVIVSWQVLPDQLAAVIWSHFQPTKPNIRILFGPNGPNQYLMAIKLLRQSVFFWYKSILPARVYCKKYIDKTFPTFLYVLNFFPIRILIVLIHKIWETSGNKLKKHSVTKNCSDLSLFE